MHNAAKRTRAVHFHHAALGDLAVFLLFPILGSANHDTTLSLDTIARTAVPTALAWAVVGLAAGAFALRTLRSPARTLAIVPAAWLVAGAIAVVARTVVFDRPFSLTFAIVAIGTTGAMLVAWRLGLAFAARR